MDTTLTITHEGRTYVAMTPEQLTEAGVPAEVIQQALDAQIIHQAEQQIDAVADRIFTASASRAARYEGKLREALQYHEAGNPTTKAAKAEYPMLAAESAARGISMKQMADAILQAAARYRDFAALAEAKRAQLKVDVPAAADEAAKQATAAAIVAEVQQAAQALQQ